MSKIGLFGGTFDPPHIGHFIVAQEVKRILQLDKVWFIPTNNPPHKPPAFFKAEDRYHMLKRATDPVDDFSVENLELKREGRSFTIDTIHILKEKYPEHHFYFIIGGDMVAYMPKWHKIEELVTLVTFVGVNRNDYHRSTNYPVTMVDVPSIDISSTDIRARLKKGYNVKYFVPHEVYLYMKEYLLDECKGSR